MITGTGRSAGNKLCYIRKNHPISLKPRLRRGTPPAAAKKQSRSGFTPHVITSYLNASSSVSAVSARLRHPCGAGFGRAGWAALALCLRPAGGCRQPWVGYFRPFPGSCFFFFSAHLGGSAPPAPQSLCPRWSTGFFFFVGPRVFPRSLGAVVLLSLPAPSLVFLVLSPALVFEV